MHDLLQVHSSDARGRPAARAKRVALASAPRPPRAAGLVRRGLARRSGRAGARIGSGALVAHALKAREAQEEYLDHK